MICNENVKQALEKYQLQERCFATSGITSTNATERESNEGGAGLNGVCRLCGPVRI